MANFLQAWRKFRGLTQEQLGELAGTDKTQISKLEKDQRRLTEAWMRRLATGLGIEPQALFQAPPTAPEPLPPGNVRVAEDAPPFDLQRLARDVPVHGVAVGGDEGDFTLNGEQVDLVRRPAGIIGRKGVFAIYVVGDSMVPWRHKGDLVYLDSIRPARPGDYVVVECHGDGEGEPGPAYLKKLTAETNVKIKLFQHNPEKAIDVPRARVKRIFRVIDWAELLGV